MKYLLAAFAIMAATTAHAQLVPAVIQPWHILPPIEFDRPYEGHLIEIKDWDIVRKVCGPWRLACALPRDGKCMIILPHDYIIEAAGLTTDVIRRHEVAHCNGWPGSHPGARRVD